MRPYDEWVANEHARVELSILADNLMTPYFKRVVKEDFDTLTKEGKRLKKLFAKGSRR